MDGNSTNDSSVESAHRLVLLSDGFSSRNLAIGVCGILINISTVPLVLISEKLTAGIKALILNLMLNDIAFMVTMVIYGADTSSHSSGNFGCWVVVFLICLTIIMSYVIILQMSLVNFLAVTMPFAFRTASKVKIIVFGNVVAWVYSITLTVACVSFNFPPHKPCFPVGSIPRSGVFSMGVSCMVCFGGVLLLNSLTIVRIKRQQRSLATLNRHESTPAAGIHHSNNMMASISRSDDRHCPIVSVLSTNMIQIPSNKVSPLPPPSTSTIIVELGSRSMTSRPSADNVPSLPLRSARMSKSESKIEFFRSAATTTNSNSGETSIGAASAFNSVEQTPRNLRNGNGMKKRAAASESSGGIDSSQQNKPISRGSGRGKRYNILNKVETIMIILTTWSCLLSLPIILYMIGLAVFVETERDVFAGNGIGITCSSLVLVNSLSNPFFYTFRFINWKMLYRKLGKLC